MKSVKSYMKYGTDLPKRITLCWIFVAWNYYLSRLFKTICFSCSRSEFLLTKHFHASRTCKKMKEHERLDDLMLPEEIQLVMLFPADSRPIRNYSDLSHFVLFGLSADLSILPELLRLQHFHPDFPCHVTSRHVGFGYLLSWGKIIFGVLFIQQRLVFYGKVTVLRRQMNPMSSDDPIPPDPA